MIVLLNLRSYLESMSGRLVKETGLIVHETPRHIDLRPGLCSRRESITLRGDAALQTQQALKGVSTALVPHSPLVGTALAVLIVIMEKKGTSGCKVGELESPRLFKPVYHPGTPIEHGNR